MPRPRIAFFSLAAMLVFGCRHETAPLDAGGGGSALPSGDPTEWSPAGPDGECNIDLLLAPPSYGAKVKALLTSLPLDAEELARLEADPGVLPDLVDEWLDLPQSRPIFERFFATAFQQTGGDLATFNYLMGRANQTFGAFAAEGGQPKSPPVDQMLNQAFSESFGRTVADIVEARRSFAEVLTTEEHQMTTAMMAFVAYVDDEVVSDDGSHTLRTTPDDFKTFEATATEPSDPEQALVPGSAGFGRFWQAHASSLPGTCGFGASQTVTADGPFVTGGFRPLHGVSGSFFAFSAMLGLHQEIFKLGSPGCNSTSVVMTPLFERGDFVDWRPVKIRKPMPGESRSRFYDLASLRGARELVVSTERLGFATTPGFQSTWMTNEDNAARVTINQILIVALGKTFHPVPKLADYEPNPPLDPEHATDECVGCHQSLDPMREFVRGSFTNFYGEQTDPQKQIQADFVLEGVRAQGRGIRGLTDILVGHPAFPRAWAQKLCYYANAAPCVEGPELDRVVSAFVASGLDFRVLVRELFSSPLVTNAACVVGAEGGLSVGAKAAIARRSTFCAELSNRLEVDDVCALRTHEAIATPLQKKVRAAIASLPDDTFSRAVAEPVVIAEPSLFSRANQEAACTLIAQDATFFDARFGGMTVDEATEAMVSRVAGLPANDVRHQGVLEVLRDHVGKVVSTTDKTERQALESAFVIACMSPSIAGVGF